jgi:Holliday junction resolvase RusA-like endonuclease
MKVHLTLNGNLPRKSNSRQMVTNKYTGRTMFIKSPEALQFERDAQAQIPQEARLDLRGRVRLTAHIHYANSRSDLSDEMLCDVIQTKFETKTVDGVKLKSLKHVGIIKDDNQIKEKHLYWHLDKEHPHIEFEIEELEPQPKLI